MFEVQAGSGHEAEVRPVVEKLIRQYQKGLLCARELAAEITLYDGQVA